MMRLTATAALTIAGTMIGGHSRAALIGAPIGLRTAADELTVI
jgi:hypothetical protein